MPGKRVDANHGLIVQTLRALGWHVVPTAHVGKGFPDALIARRGVLRQVEIKDGAKSPSRRRLTEDEAKYHQGMALVGCPVVVIENVQQAQELR